MTGRYTAGFDLPPLMRDSLIEDEAAAAAFAALPFAKQQRAAEQCSKLGTRCEIDELIRATDCFMFEDIALSEFDPLGSLKL